MNVLFLDDSHTRHDFVCKKAHDTHETRSCLDNGYLVYHVYRVSEFINALKTLFKDAFYFDIVCLDHDLSRDDPTNIGTVAAKYLADNYGKYQNMIGKIIIHSWNPAGAKNMEAILRDGGYRDILVSPFSVA